MTELPSRKVLMEQIDSMLFERTAIATKPDELIKKELADLRDDSNMSPDLDRANQKVAGNCQGIGC